MYIPQYKTPKCDMDEVDAEVDRLINEDLIEFSSSDFNSPLLPVRKKSGKLRICLDLRNINKYINKMRWPLPNINDMLSKLKGATNFCVIDLKSAFNQILLESGSRNYTTFRTNKGAFRHKRLCFGLSNAPSSMQKLIGRVTEGLDFTTAF